MDLSRKTAVEILTNHGNTLLGDSTEFGQMIVYSDPRKNGQKSPKITTRFTSNYLPPSFPVRLNELSLRFDLNEWGNENHDSSEYHQ